MPAVGVEHAVEEADEASLGDVAAQDPVHLMAERARLDRFRRERAHRGLQVRHQQRRRNAFADDVRDRERQARVVETDGVEAIAADAGGGLPRHGELPAVDLRHLLRQQALLDLQRLRQARAARRRLRGGARGRLSISWRSVASRCALSHGFCTKSRTPRRIASTARSTLPQPVITITGSSRSSCLHAREQIDALAPRGRVAGVVQIHQHEIERPRLERAQRRLGRGHGVVFDPLALEQQLQSVEQVGLIVRDQDPGCHVTGDGHAVGRAEVQSACHHEV